MTIEHYTLVGDMPLHLNGKSYGDGDIVEIDAAAAEALVKAGRLKAVTAKNTKNTK